MELAFNIIKKTLKQCFLSLKFVNTCKKKIQHGINIFKVDVCGLLDLSHRHKCCFMSSCFACQIFNSWDHI